MLRSLFRYLPDRGKFSLEENLNTTEKMILIDVAVIKCFETRLENVDATRLLTSFTLSIKDYEERHSTCRVLPGFPVSDTRKFPEHFRLGNQASLIAYITCRKTLAIQPMSW